MQDVKDLGVIVDSHLSFDTHISTTVARAFTRVNLIHKCFISRNAETSWRAFVVYVRPLLEYCSSCSLDAQKDHHHHYHFRLLIKLT